MGANAEDPVQATNGREPADTQDRGPATSVPPPDEQPRPAEQQPEAEEEQHQAARERQRIADQRDEKADESARNFRPDVPAQRPDDHIDWLGEFG